MSKKKPSPTYIGDPPKNTKRSHTSKSLFLKAHQELIENYINTNLSYSKISQNIEKIYSKKISSETIRKFALAELGTQKYRNNKPNKVLIAEKIQKYPSLSFLEIYHLFTDKEKSFLEYRLEEILLYSEDNYGSESTQSVKDFFYWMEEKMIKSDKEIIGVVLKIEKYFLSEKNYQFSPDDINFFGDEKTFLKIIKLLKKRNIYTAKDLSFFAVKTRDDYADYLSVIYD